MERVPIRAGVHNLRHADPTVRFAAYVYGWGSSDAYAYPAGSALADLYGACSPTTTSPADLRDNDCDGQVDEEAANGVDDDGDTVVDEDLAPGMRPANRAPIAYDFSREVTADAPSGGLVLRAFDADGDTLSYDVISGPSHGTLGHHDGLAQIAAPTAFTSLSDVDIAMHAPRSSRWLLRLANVSCVALYVTHLWFPIDMAVDIIGLACFVGYGLALFALLVLRLARACGRTEPQSGDSFLLGAWCLVVAGSLGAAIPVRGVLYQRAVQQGTSIVEAIARFESETGSPPPALRSLVPRYLGAIPKSGLSFCPEFTYGTSVRRDIRTWSIWLDCALLYPPFAVLRYESWRASDPEYSSGWALGD